MVCCTLLRAACLPWTTRRSSCLKPLASRPVATSEQREDGRQKAEGHLALRDPPYVETYTL